MDKPKNVYQGAVDDSIAIIAPTRGLERTRDVEHYRTDCRGSIIRLLKPWTRPNIDLPPGRSSSFENLYTQGALLIARLLARNTS